MTPGLDPIHRAQLEASLDWAKKERQQVHGLPAPKANTMTMQTLNINGTPQNGYGAPPPNGYQNGNGEGNGNGNGRLPKILFEPNIPQILALRYTDGREVPSQFNTAPQIMFTTTDGRVMFVPPIVRDELARLQIQNGEEFQLTKTVHGAGKAAQVRWVVARAPIQNGPQPVPAPAAPQSATPRNGIPVVGPPPPPTGTVEYEDAVEAFLVITGRATVRAQKALSELGCHITFTEESIQKMATTALIQAARSGHVTWNGRRL